MNRAEKLTLEGLPEPMTVPDFIETVSAALTHGGVTVEGEYDAERERHVKIIRISTGGYSSDETLVYRITYGSVFSLFWESTHRGGLVVFHVPLDRWESSEKIMWLSKARPEVIEVDGPVEVAFNNDIGPTYTLSPPEGHGIRIAAPPRLSDTETIRVEIKPVPPLKLVADDLVDLVGMSEEELSDL